MDEAKHFVDLIGHAIQKGIFNVEEPIDSRMPVYARGAYVQGDQYQRGDMVSIHSVGIYIALTETRADPRTNSPDWATFAVFPYAYGGGASTPVVPPFVETITNMTYDAATGTLVYQNEAGVFEVMYVASSFAISYTGMTYDPATSIITYTAENGSDYYADLSALGTNLFLTGATYDAATQTLTLVDADGVTPDVVINLGAYSATLVRNVDGTYTHTSAGVVTVIDFRLSVAALPTTNNYDGRIVEFNGLFYKYLATPGTYIQILV